MGRQVMRKNVVRRSEPVESRVLSKARPKCRDADDVSALEGNTGHRIIASDGSVFRGVRTRAGPWSRGSLDPSAACERAHCHRSTECNPRVALTQSPNL
jgi:hypothetical protein